MKVQDKRKDKNMTNAKIVGFFLVSLGKNLSVKIHDQNTA